MRFQCPECKAINKVAAGEYGKEISCQNCNTQITVPADKFSPGAIIGDDFVIIREIAKGGMGIVYLAQQLSLDRPAALKILQGHLCDDKNLVDGLIQEARLAAKLNHPNIVQAYAVGNDDGVVFFAMEYVDGPTMKAVLAEEKILDFKRAAQIISQIAGALHFAWNERKLTHRDIKPDNIIISNSSGRAKLADLGLSKIGTASNVTENGEVLGTPQYISPEQLTGSEIDCRSDIYSLGATLFQFITGRYAYVGENTDEIAKQHVAGNLTPPKELNPAIPGILNDIVMKMMALLPANRYQNPQEVRIALDKFIAVADNLAAATSPKGAAPAISIIKVNTKKSTSEKNVPQTAEPEAEAPKAAAPKAAVAIPRAASPKAAAKPVAAPKAAVAKPAMAAPVPAQQAGDTVIAPPDPPQKPQKGNAPKGFEEIKKKREEEARKKAERQKKTRLLLCILAGIVVLAAAAAVIFLVPTSSEEEAAPQPTTVYADYAIRAREIIDSGATLSDAEFLAACDEYFLKVKLPDTSAPHDLAIYQELRDAYALKEESFRLADIRSTLFRERMAAAEAAQAEAEKVRLAEEELRRTQAQNDRALAEYQRNIASSSAAYLRKLQAESKLAAQYFFEAMIAGDPNIFVTKTSGFSIMNPDMSLLTPSDAEKARALRTAASEAFKALDSNIEAIRRFSVDKSLIAGTQLPWGKDVIFRIDDFDGEKMYVTEIYTNEKTELVFADLKPEVLQQINGIIDRRIEAMQANMQGVNFTEDPDRHYLFFTLLRSNCHASWMKAIAPNATWEMLIDGLVVSEAK